MPSAEADFLNGFTALLTDGKLRRRFAECPEKIAAQLCADEAAAVNLAAIHPQDLHYQAEILLKKRYAAIKRYLPPTVVDSPVCNWAIFRAYVDQVERRAPGESPWLDSLNFLKFISDVEGIYCQRELNRLEFLASGTRVAIKLLWRVGKRPLSLAGLQVLTRKGNGCRDVVIGFLGSLRL